MLTFIENILKGVKQWTESLLEERDYVTASHIVELHTTKQDVTDNSLNTTAKTIVGAINELEARIAALEPQEELIEE